MEVAKPIIRKIDDTPESLKIFEEDLCSYSDENVQEIITSYPTVYIHNWKESDEYEVYIGESNNVIQRTRQHYETGLSHIDQNTGNQLTCENIILQYSNYVPYDPNGYLNVDTQSGGEGKYITRGKAIDIHWTKDSQWGITHYYDSNNQEIQLNPGKTWVEIVLNDSVGSVSLQ